MSCLFNSLSAFVKEPPQTIRGRICDFLATDPALLDDLKASLVIAIESGKGLGPYVATMRSSNTWGGAIEIRAFVQLWRRPVKVYVIRTRRWIEFPYTGTAATAATATAAGSECKISWTGGHYEPIR